MKGAAADRAALEDILRYAGRVRAHTGTGRPSLEDERTRDAVLYELAIIGEAANRLSVEVREAHSEVPWRQVVGQRNILVHVYDRLNLDRVWNAVEAVPALVRQVEAILREVVE